jgi:hypothetical protein
MNVAARIAAFAIALAGVGGAAALAGAAIDPGRPGGSDQSAKGHGMAMQAHASDLRLVVDTPGFERGVSAPMRFRIVDAADETVRDFDAKHTKRMHLIVVRRDLTAFQHLHPRLAADGTWTTDLRLPDAGSYTAFADFSHGGESQTLASDVRVNGDAVLRPLPPPSDVATADGFVVRRDGLNFRITRAGRPVMPDPYLGARGHLVALREGYLEYLHVHPHANSVSFEADFPTPGRYRLFLQFALDGNVHTVAFTHEVTG